MLETTVRCNLRCPMCPRTGARLPAEDLPSDLLFGALEQHAALGGDLVYLYGLGEPLLDPRLPEILAACRRLGLASAVSTNGTLLDGARATALLDAPPDHLLVSIDATSPETYARVRAGGDLGTVEANVRAFAAARAAGRAGSDDRARRLRDSQLVVQFVRLPANLGEAAGFAARWRDVPGVDGVRLKDEDIGLPDHRLRDPAGDARANPCHLLWRGPLLVRWNGDVFPCYHKAPREAPLGNLRERSLAELWSDAELRRLRRLHAEGRSGQDPSCASCPAVRPRLPVVLGAMALSGRAQRRLLPIAERVALSVPAWFRERGG